MDKDQEINVISVSGGKDSTAMLLLAIERGTENIRPVFCDTGNEHPLTYDYVRYLADAVGIEIEWVKADFSAAIERKRVTVETKWREEGISEKKIAEALSVLHPTGTPFLDMIVCKGRFPSTRMRFCSIELKANVLRNQVQLPLIRDGIDVVSWQGIRHDESKARACAVERDFAMKDEATGAEMWNYRPILDWTAEDCFDMMRRHGIDPNPLYKMGMGRVGCMPCVNCRKAELREIANRFPAEINRIEEWERIGRMAGKHSSGTFFPEANGNGSGIRAAVEWSRTVRGGKQLDIFADGEHELTTCSSKYGLCE